MRERREIERAPMWASFAAPFGLILLAAAAGFAAALVIALIGRPEWSWAITVPVAAIAFDLWWRRTQPTSRDGAWSLTARWLYRRRPPD